MLTSLLLDTPGAPTLNIVIVTKVFVGWVRGEVGRPCATSLSSIHSSSATAVHIYRTAPYTPLRIFRIPIRHSSPLSHNPCTDLHRSPHRVRNRTLPPPPQRHTRANRRAPWPVPACIPSLHELGDLNLSPLLFLFLPCNQYQHRHSHIDIDIDIRHPG